MGEVVLSVKGLKRGFYVRKGGLLRGTTTFAPAVNGITFEIGKGEIFGLLGPNGAGKTTTIDIISGILTADDGEIRYFGQPLDAAVKSRMNTTTAYASLYDDLTVYQNLRIFAELYSVPAPKARITEIITLFELADKLDTKLENLSAGQKTRVKLAKALLNKPELLLLDEATIGLDPDIAAKVRGIIKNLGTTILFTSHNMDEVATLCDRIAFLSQGRIIAIGTPQELTRLITEQELIIEYEKGTRAFTAFLKRHKASIVDHAVEAKRLRLRIPHTGNATSDTLKQLFNTKCGIADITIEKPHLEDVFVKMAEEGR